ncbi:NAD(P)H-dependent glycerol-3-phosphate dehydrogenase [Levilactobacillus zymae]|uniref:Glycerol-3-phosphate dehydrogenase [NAD(P)+] n=1 Tax=Levilactobacillus zymae TaxID=267363 RepID=A0A1Y6JX99_9LACO|nr:NAD(P)H-dependent glycerol-3-phosphate dehydrogenase [Levilactobacillus zymae]KRL15368.1 glycerol-3-phosphate dehydrogenase [Levilactobacillus zymae DSM 19395]QFR61260.1 NAD(P)H-dependent glycerol-3-phosphate dehydrogenase [Levilactobacillus zymae]GEO72318.1 glycerol-3-phosphate dehydrogenase [NAD(P)+] [Levilactobacillus zymae]SMS13741.1 Glycerol-3-phosphate dehydrogenase [NAD(P)+] [Levilactobacillus zymae]
MSEKIAVLGAGSWGSILASVLDENGHDVRLWSYNPKQVEELNTQHTNSHYIKNFTFSKSLVAYADMASALDGVDAILFVVPTKAVRSVAHEVAGILAAKHLQPELIHASKGIEQKTYKRISQILEEEIPAANRKSVTVLSGPSHAEDVARHDITLITAASANPEAAKHTQKRFMTPYFRVYTNSDVIGVEIGAALKNIIALGAGALHGLGYGDNAKAALMTRGLAEISRLGTSFGADPMTFIGLSGVGDVIVTATSTNSRNWRAGDELGRGEKLDDVISHMGMVIEGLATTKAAYELSQKRGVSMPITEAIYQVLYEGKDIKTAISDLMQREGRSEF